MQKALLIFIILLSQISYSRESDPYVNQLRQKTYLKLPDNREIIITYHSNHFEDGNYKTRIFLRHNAKIIWDKTFGESLGELWYGASFIPLFEKQYYWDLNQDGDLEIAVAVEHGGQAGWNSRALIFTVKQNGLALLRKQNINIEFSKWVYHTPNDFNNTYYQCELCK